MGKLDFGQTHARPPATIGGGIGSGLDIAFASYEQLRLVDNSNAAAAALEDAYAARTRAVKDATGIDLGNPLFGEAAGFDVEAAQRQARGELGAELAVQGGRIAQQKASYAQRLAELEKQFPDKAGIIRSAVPVERDAEALAKSADDRLSMLMTSNPDWSSYAWAFAGGAVGSFRDPLVVGSLALGGGPGAARTIAGRIITVAAKEALLNGATTAATQPFVQDWRRQAGLTHGYDEAAQNVLFAAGFGGLLGAGGGAVGELFAAGGRRAAAARLEELALADPDVSVSAKRAIAGEIDAALEILQPLREGLPPEARGALDALEQRAAERAQLEEAYGLVSANPTGPVRDPLVEITPDDIDKLIVARGAFRNINELDLSSRSGWGLVKVIWRHGEASTKPPELQIRRDDITALPDVLRDFEASRTGENWREWRVLRDGRVIVYADATMPEGRHLVTAYVQEPGSKGADLPLSRKKGGRAGSSSDVFSAPGDTGPGLSQSTPGGQPKANIDLEDAADKAQRIAAETQRRHDILLSRVEEAERLRQLPDLVLDEPERVNRIVRELAPKAESIADPGGVLGELPDVDAIIRQFRESVTAGEAARRPVLKFLKALGGIDPGSAIAAELRAIGINTRSAPGLFSRSGLKALDNIPLDELPDGIRLHAGADDGNGYARQQAFIDGLQSELEGRPWAANGGDEAAGLDEYRAYLEANGVDFATMSDDEIRAQLLAIEDAERRFLAAEPNDVGLSTDEVSFLPPGVTRRAYTAEVVRDILGRTGAGVSDDVVRVAAEAHIGAGETIEDAVEFALSQAAGTRRTLPQSEFAELGAEPPAPKADAPVDPPDEDAIDWGALEELGFGSGAVIPFGDDVVSLEALKADLDETAWLENVVNACKI